MGSDHVVDGMALPTKAAVLFLPEKREESEEIESSLQPPAIAQVEHFTSPFS